MSSHSIVPLDHWTTGLTREQLKGLIERHAVRFEVAPYQRVTLEGSLARDGWTIDLYGSPSPSDRALDHDTAVAHVHDVLYALSIAVRPVIPEGLVVEDEPFHGKTVLDPKKDFAEETHKRLYVLRDSAMRTTMLGDADTDWTRELGMQLELLGARPR